MEYSGSKYNQFIQFLLYKLNFVPSEFLDEYTQKLQKTIHQFKAIGNTENEKDLRPYCKYEFDGKVYAITDYQLPSYLQLEYEIKSKKKYERITSKNSKYVTPSDIASYTFCPVSYSITNSIQYTTLESANIGTKLHSEKGLSTYFKSSSAKQPKSGDREVEVNDRYYKSETIEKLEAILANYDVVYAGHQEEGKNKYFYNVHDNFRGQPDFILQHKKTKKYIVVEEKFQWEPDFYLDEYGQLNVKNDFAGSRVERAYEKSNHSLFYPNHINQLKSYIYGIKDYEIERGVLIYWKYSTVVDEETGERFQKIDDCVYKVIDRKYEKEDRAQLNAIVAKIWEMNQKQSVPYDLTTRNVSKCASCVHNFLCGHKTGNFKTLSYPYHDDYLKVKGYLPFPEEARRNEYSPEIKEAEVEIKLNDKYCYEATPEEILEWNL